MKKVQVGRAIQKYTVDLYIIKQKRKLFDEKRKGSNRLFDDEVTESILFEALPESDVSVVAYQPENCNVCILVLLRIHNRKRLMKHSETTRLYNHMSEDGMLSHGGFNCARSAGSSGRTEFNGNMSKFLNVPITFPQKSPGVKLVQNQLDWYGFYISPWTSQTCKMRYGQPVVGGRIQKNLKAFQNCRRVLEMTTLKFVAVQVLRVINFKFWSIIPPILSAAIQRELNVMKLAFGKNRTWITHCALQYKLTLVQHAVGFHKDVFSRGESSLLEVRKVFTNYEKNPENGRGGAGINKFCLAILCW